MGGRPKKPTAIKKLQGTFRADRDSKAEENAQIPVRILPSSKLAVPRTIRASAVKKAYKNHIALLRAIGAENAADSPLLETAYRSLGEALRILAALEELDADDDKYRTLLKNYGEHLKMYDSIARAFFLTPKARAQLRLDFLSAREKEIQIKKGQSVIESLISKKES